MSDAIEPFRIHVDDAALADLKSRLAATRWPDQIEGTGWEYGAEQGYVRELVETWRDGFDWREAEQKLNRFDHFQTRIDGQRIHFLHARSPHENALPLLVSHGWPGSIVEFLEVIGPLTNPEAFGGSREDAFHVVCPSLPGYGFSEPTRSRQWDVHRMAQAFALLMRRLGYARYGAQGGDWGALVTTNLARLDPDHLAGIHLNMPMALPRPNLDDLTEEERADVAAHAVWEQQEAGYQRIQGTKPQTLGFSLMDSPAGLAAWIVEKFRGWSDCDGHPENVFTRDQLLTNISVYWFTGTITSSMRLYYEVFKGGRVGFIGDRIEVPTGVARFPKEIFRFPRSWVNEHYNVTHWTVMPRGGHFAAMEQPDLYVGDVRSFFRTLR